MSSVGLIIALGQGEEGFVELNQLEGYPVFLHAVRNMGEAVEDVVLAVTGGSKDSFDKAISEYGFGECSLLELNCPNDVLTILKEGLSAVDGEIVVTAPANAPLIPVDLLSLLVELCEKRDAVLVRDVGGGIDWFLSAYRRRSFMEAVNAKGLGNVEDVIDELKRIMYIAHSTIKDLDPMLFSNIRVTRATDIPLIEKFIKRSGRRR